MSRRIFLALAGVVLPITAHAQVSFDTARVTCADYVAMSPADVRLFSAFLSGWVNQKLGKVTVDLNEYDRNVAKLQNWCRDNPKQIAFAALQQVTGTAGK